MIGAAVATPLIASFGLITAMLLVTATVTAYAVALVLVSHRRAGHSRLAASPADQSLLNSALVAKPAPR